MKGSHEDRGALAISANAFLLGVSALALFLLPNVSVATALILLSLALGLMAIFVGIVFDHAIALRRLRVVLAGLLVFVCLLVSFAGLYHDQSEVDHKAFSEHLNRLGALYFAAGVISTAGTNGVNARSETARAGLAVQELADVTMVALLIGGVLHRLAHNAIPESRRRRRPVVYGGPRDARRRRAAERWRRSRGRRHRRSAR
jgi:hypothetical protein